MTGRPPKCPVCSGHHLSYQRCRDRCSECLGYHGYHASCNGPRAHQTPGQQTTNPSVFAGYGQQIAPVGYGQQTNSSSPPAPGPGTGWFDPAYKRRQGASGPQMGLGSRGEKSKGEKRKREAADNAENKTGPEQGPKNPQKTRNEKRAKTAKKAEEARQQLDQLKSLTAETDKLNAELLALFKSGAKQEQVAELMGRIEQAHLRRKTAEQDEQEDLLKQHKEAVQKQQRLEEQLLQVQQSICDVHELQSSLRARMNEASLSTVGTVDLALRPAESTQQASAETSAKIGEEKLDMDMKEGS